MVRQFKEYDCVSVLAVPQAASFSGESEPQVGDVGTVLMVFSDGAELAYEVECVSEQGSTRWLGTLGHQCLEAVSKPSDEAG